MHTFHTPNPVVLTVRLSQGDVLVYADDTDTTTVELVPVHGDSAAQELIDRARVEQRGDKIIVDVPSGKGGLFGKRSAARVTIHVPTRSEAKIETHTADVETTGQLGDVTVSSGSGDIRLDRTDEVSIRAGSGDITLGSADGDAELKGGSADVSVGTVRGNAEMLTGSGDVVVDTVAKGLKIKSGSGDVVVKNAGDRVDALIGSGDLMIKRVDHGAIQAKTGSGDIQIGVAEGTPAYLDVMTVTGDVKVDLEAADAPSDDDRSIQITVQSGSGDVVLLYA